MAPTSSEDDDQPKSLAELCDRIEAAPTENDRFQVETVLEMVGRRSFGPLLLVAGVVLIMPFVGDIPGVTTLTAILVFLIAVQMVLKREYFWLPRFLLDRSIARDKMCKALGWIRPVARFVDRFTKPRMRNLTRGPVVYGVAVVCTAIALVMPVMEVVPFGAMVAGAALSMFGLSLIARDGLLALLAFVFTALTFGIAGYGLL